MSKLRCLLTAVTVAVMAAVGFALPVHATFPARNGLIAFSAQVGATFQIFTVDPNGHGLRQVTHALFDAVDAEWSPDGRQIAFTMGTGGDCSTVALMNADGSHLVTLAPIENACEGQPSFTPDGQRIIFERYDPSTNVDAIWSMNLTGGDRHEITTGTGAGVTDPNVSPDGKTLSFVDFNGQDFGQALFTSGIDGSNLHQVTPFTFDVAIKQDWAPDGKHLVFTDNADFPHPGDSANAATIRPTGADLRYLTHYTGGQVNAFVGSYSPDGHWIVFRLEDHGRYGLYVMRPDGTGLHAILPLSSFKPRFIDWGPGQGGEALAQGAVSSTRALGSSGSFTVWFDSSLPGQGYVLFGPGPGCMGLVGLATQDAGAGSTQHAVEVTGDEMNLTAGAVLPGTTYSYEVETVTKTGLEIDNNGGQCYSVTVPRM